MPLHLLGKKSWNVYNQDNIVRVRQDEAKAAAREATAQQEKQDLDAHLRMKLLRHDFSDKKSTPILQSPKILDAKATATSYSTETSSYPENHSRRLKRRRGEDDTDRDIRYAKRSIDEQTLSEGRSTLKPQFEDTCAEIPIVDHNGNINLFIAERQVDSTREKRRTTDTRSEGLPAGLVEANKKLGGDLRPANVQGHQRKSEQRAWQRPIYETGKNFAFGKAVDDSFGRRKDIERLRRSQAREAADDPLVAMKRGAQQVRENESKRREGNKRRIAELRSIKPEEHLASSLPRYTNRRRNAG